MYYTQNPTRFRAYFVACFLAIAQKTWVFREILRNRKPLQASSMYYTQNPARFRAYFVACFSAIAQKTWVFREILRNRKPLQASLRLLVLYPICRILTSVFLISQELYSF